MASDLVSARVPYAKKEAASGVLKSLGATTSDLINDAFNVVLAHKKLPSACVQNAERRTGFDAFVQASTLSIDWSEPEKSDKDIIRQGRLSDYESLA